MADCYTCIYVKNVDQDEFEKWIRAKTDSYPHTEKRGDEWDFSVEFHGGYVGDFWESLAIEMLNIFKGIVFQGVNSDCYDDHCIHTRFDCDGSEVAINRDIEYPDEYEDNSDRRSFIMVNITTKQGDSFRGGFDSGTYNNISDFEEEFNASKKFFEKLTSGEDLIIAMKEWFVETLLDTDSLDEFDFTNGNVEEISRLNIEDIEEIELSSMVDFGDFSIGSDISYNYKTKKRKRI